MKSRAKAQRRKLRRKEDASSLRLPLRLCAFARDFFPKICGLLILLCFGILPAHATTPTRVTISMPVPGEIRVEAELSRPTRSWSFRNAYAGVLGIAERIGDFRAQDASVKKIATGEFRSDLDATKISYNVKLSELRATDLPHVSWLAYDRGLLMFADLIPQDIESLSAQFTLPTGWTAESSITGANGRYEVSEPQKAVFFVGRSLRKISSTTDGLDVVLNGSWPFREPEALKAASDVMKKYLDLR